MTDFLKITLEGYYPQTMVININHIAKIFDEFDRRIIMCDGTSYALSYESYKELVSIISNKGYEDA